jgi:uncharacterized damage-inducible protein DinB
MHISTLLFFLHFSDVVVNQNCEGITHEESLMQTKGAQSFNWVLGHFVRTRNDILEFIWKKPLYEKSKFEIYTPKDFDPKKAVDIQELQKSFNALQTELKNGIEGLTVEKLNQPTSLVPGRESTDTIGSVLATILWHEAYHAGQLGIIRRLVGKPGKIKNPAGE